MRALCAGPAGLSSFASLAAGGAGRPLALRSCSLGRLSFVIDNGQSRENKAFGLFSFLCLYFR